MTAIRRIIALASLLMAAGCGPRGFSQRLNGTYEGSTPVQVNPGTDPVVAHQLGLIKLIAKEDGTAFLSAGGVAVDGHIEYGVDSATFVPDSILGIPMSRQPRDVQESYRKELKPVGDSDWLYGGSVTLSPVVKK